MSVIAMFPGQDTIDLEKPKKELQAAMLKLEGNTHEERDLVRVIDPAEHEELETAYKEALDKIRFLKLPDADSFSSTFGGDVTFVVQASVPRVIHAHRLVLGTDILLCPWVNSIPDGKFLNVKFFQASRSTVFSRMFDAGMLEEQTGRITINDASYCTMRAVVDYCYTADIVFGGDVHPEEVLKVAHKYDIIPLRKLCDHELCSRVTAESLPAMLRLSRTYEAPSLQRAAMIYFKEHFDTVHEIVLENLLSN